MSNEINISEVIKKIDSRVMLLNIEEKKDIFNILAYHSCEPSAAAERISEYLQVSYESIFDLL